jgi:hypothetical protein
VPLWKFCDNLGIYQVIPYETRKGEFKSWTNKHTRRIKFGWNIYTGCHQKELQTTVTFSTDREM